MEEIMKKGDVTQNWENNRRYSHFTLLPSSKLRPNDVTVTWTNDDWSWETRHCIGCEVYLILCEYILN